MAGHQERAEVAGFFAQRHELLDHAARAARDYESLGPCVNFHAMVSYLLGRPDDFNKAIELR